MEAKEGYDAYGLEDECVGNCFCRRKTRNNQINESDNPLNLEDLVLETCKWMSKHARNIMKERFTQRTNSFKS